MSRTLIKGRQYTFYYNSFEENSDYDNIDVVKEAASLHGEDCVTLYVMEDGVALRQYTFHARLDEEEWNPQALALSDDQRDTISCDGKLFGLPSEGVEVLSKVFNDTVRVVTRSEMNSLMIQAGFVDGIGSLYFRS